MSIIAPLSGCQCLGENSKGGETQDALPPEAAARNISIAFASASAGFALSAQVVHHLDLRRHAHFEDNCIDGYDKQFVCSSVRVEVF